MPEYMRLLGKAYNTEDKQEFYKFTQALEALNEHLKRRREDHYS